MKKYIYYYLFIRMQVERGSKCNYQVIYMCFTCVSKRERKRKLSNHNFVNKLLTRILYI